MEKEISCILNKSKNKLSSISGVNGIVLGGSRARGTHSSDSDIDIGIYYTSAELDLVSLNKAAQELDDEHRENLIAPPGAWGQWVNGGGWLIIDGFHVDLILRDTARVEDEIKKCLKEEVSAHYQTGHPHAYINAIYMGELAMCKVLWDKGTLSSLKQTAQNYPPKLKSALIDFFMFEAGFSLMFAKSNASRNDSYYVTAHIVRSVSALNQVLFALNEEYCLNEKKAIQMIDSFDIHPINYSDKVEHIFREAGLNNESACNRLESLVNEVKGLLP